MRMFKTTVAGLALGLIAIGAAAAQGRDARSEAMAIQEALIWSGHYDGTIDGRIGGGTRDAIRGFQREIGHRPTGDLTPDELSELATRAARLRDEVGYQRYEDPDTGIVIGLPLRLAPPAGQTGRGSRFVSADGAVEIELFRFDSEQGTIAELYRRVQSGSSERRVTYKRLGRSWFVVSGVEGRLEFYTRGRSEGSGVAAFAIAYDSSLEETVEPIIVAMSSSFARPDVLSLETLVPGGAAQYEDEEALDGDPRGDDYSRGGASQDETAASLSDEPAEPLGPRDRSPIAAAFLVSEEGHVLTSSRAARCGRIAVGGLGEAALIAVDPEHALALLKLTTAPGRATVGFSDRPAHPGDSVVAAGPEPDGPSYVVNAQVAHADAALIRVAVPSRANDGGTPLFDAGGSVAGVLLPLRAETSGDRHDPRPTVRAALTAAAVDGFLRGQGVATGYEGRQRAGAPEDVAEQARRATLPVFCR